MCKFPNMAQPLKECLRPHWAGQRSVQLLRCLMGGCRMFPLSVVQNGRLLVQLGSQSAPTTVPPGWYPPGGTVAGPTWDPFWVTLAHDWISLHPPSLHRQSHQAKKRRWQHPVISHQLSLVWVGNLKFAKMGRMGLSRMD